MIAAAPRRDHAAGHRPHDVPVGLGPAAAGRRRCGGTGDALSRPARTVALTLAYAVIELRTLVKVLRGNRDCDQLIEDFLVAAYAAVRGILDVEVALDSASAPARKAFRATSR